jgi:hypothetical protein
LGGRAAVSWAEANVKGGVGLTDTFNQQFRVVDGVHDAVVTDANAPLAIAAPELPGARWTRIGFKAFQVRKEAHDQWAGELLEFPLGT